MSLYTRPLAFSAFALVAAACAAPTEEVTSAASAADSVGGEAPFAYEATLDYGRAGPAIPAGIANEERYTLARVLPRGDSTTQRAYLRIAGVLRAGAVATDVSASNVRRTSGEGGGPGTDYYTCVTTMKMTLGTVRAELVDRATGVAVRVAEQPLVTSVYFESPAHVSSRCEPHRYPSFDRQESVRVSRPDAPVPFEALSLALGDGSNLRVSSYDIAVPLSFSAVADGASYRLSRVAAGSSNDRDGRRSTRRISWSRQAAGAHPSSAITADAPLREMGVVGHQLVRSTVTTPGCGRVSPTGDVQFFLSYERSLAPGARVYVRYAAADAYRGTLEPWRDDREVELSRDARTGDFRGLVTRRASGIGSRDVVSQLGSAAAHLPITLPADYARAADNFTSRTDAIAYTYRIVAPDGTETFDNGSTSRWGNYLARVSSRAFLVCGTGDAFAVEDDSFVAVFSY